MKKKPYYSANDTPMERNSLIYCYNNNTHEFYKIISVHQNHVTCYKQGRFPAIFNETPALQWNRVGVYKMGSLSNEKQYIPYQSICGKALNVLNFLITCPINILR